MIKSFIFNRKQLRKRTFKLIQKLQQIMKTIGKIRIILKKNRRKKALKVSFNQFLKIFFVPYTTR